MILPASLQFKDVVVTGEFASLPEHLIHQARFIARAPDGTGFFDRTMPIHRLSNRQITITFEPETIEDQEIMNAYGGLDNTPSYLIRLRPVLTVDNEREAIGLGGLPAGADFTLSIDLIAPNGSETFENPMIAGNLMAIGLVAQNVVAPAVIPQADKTAPRLQHERVLDYIERFNQAENELASLLRLRLARPLASVVTAGGVLDVDYLLDTPHGYEWKGVYLDADLRTVEIAGSSTLAAGLDSKLIFMQLAGLQGSVLEHQIFEEGYQVAAISTAKLLALANETGVPLVTLDAANIATQLPGLNLPENIAQDIQNAIHQGLTVTIPATEMTVEDWTGYGYIKENPATGEAGNMLSGGIAGGMSILAPWRWLSELIDILKFPFIDPPNNDPASGASIHKLSDSDGQTATVGQTLAKPNYVMVRDKKGRPVRGASVTFKVRAGGGSLNAAGVIGDTVTVATDSQGLAKANLTLGEHTADNPDMWWEQGYTYSQQVGQNIVDARLQNGVALASPFAAYGFPDAPAILEQLAGSNTGGYVLTWIGANGVLVKDRFGNPIANAPVSFVMSDPVEKSPCPLNPNQDLRPGLLIANNDPCLVNVPLYGQCGTKTITVASGQNGAASVQVMLGGVPNADYKITVGTPGLVDNKEITVSSYQFGSCNGQAASWSRIIVNAPYNVDAHGIQINAAKVGGAVPLKAKVYWLLEKEKEVGMTFDCDNGDFHCARTIVGSREYEIVTDFDSEAITFGGQAATAQGIGPARMHHVDYQVGATPGKQNVVVHADTMRSGNFNTDLCSNSCQVVPKPIHLYDDAQVEVYAVDITTPARLTLAVDDNGIVNRDQVVSFDILPAEYRAANAFLVLLEKSPADAEFVQRDFIPVAASGHGEALFSRGFAFDFRNEYAFRIVLNLGSVSEITSDIVPIQPVALSLGVDLDHDAIPDNSLAKATAPGLVLALNQDDDDRDGVIDSADIVLADPNGQPVGDDDLIPARLVGKPGGLNQGLATLAAIQGGDKLRIWLDAKKQLLLLDPTGGITQKTWTLGTDVPALSDLPGTLYIEGIAPSTSPDDQAVLTLSYTDASGNVIETDRLLLTVVPVAMVPDYNRDGKIDANDRNRVTEEKPWRFWVNDDNDQKSDPATGLDGDDTPGQIADLEEDYDPNTGQPLPQHVNGIRDLVDFFPLHLDLQNALAVFSPQNGYSYVLKQADAAVSMVEANVVAAVLTIDNAKACLEDLDASARYKDAETRIANALGVTLSTGFLQAIKDNNQTGIILVEGRKASTKPLILEIRDSNSAVVAQASFPLEIVPITEMTGLKDLRYVAGGAAGEPDRAPAKPPLTMTEGSDKVLVWMHGYNVDPIEAKATFSEVFKRFFHGGLTGEFYGVSWFGNPPGTLAPHYHQSVVNAFATAGDFAAFVNGLSNNGRTVSIAAHSLGNLVVGEAIQNHSLVFDKYFAIDAAVALEAYGAVSDVSTLVNPVGSFAEDPNAAMIKVADWPDYIGAGQSRLLASEWYKLFDASDNRSKLTWRNRLSTVPSDKIYNFYSSTEDVLARYDSDNVVLDGAGLFVFDRYAWVKQEKAKGRPLAPNIAGVSSPFAGWSFSSYWVRPAEPDQLRKYSPQEARDEITDEALKAHPFFALETGLFVSHRLDSLVQSGAAPSSFVAELVFNTGLMGYYTDNSLAHPKVTVLDWLLAEAFPATTLPMGANKNKELPLLNSIDMSADKNNEGCKTNEDKWPQIREGEWYHSDYKDMPYQHVYEFYKRINGLVK